MLPLTTAVLERVTTLARTFFCPGAAPPAADCMEVGAPALSIPNSRLVRHAGGGGGGSGPRI